MASTVASNVGGNVEKVERTRLSAQDWEQAALDLMAEQGVNAVAVEPLARRIGVTKGSFYWHFPNREALLQAALQRWEQDDLHHVLTEIESIPDPRERLCELFRRASRGLKPHAVYSALFAAADHPSVAPVLKRVAERRLNYLANAFQELGMSEGPALHRARLTYTAYIGYVQMALRLQPPHLSHEDFEGYVEHVIATLIPTGPGSAPA